MAGTDCFLVRLAIPVVLLHGHTRSPYSALRAKVESACTGGSNMHKYDTGKASNRKEPPLQSEVKGEFTLSVLMSLTVLLPEQLFHTG